MIEGTLILFFLSGLLLLSGGKPFEITLIYTKDKKAECYKSAGDLAVRKDKKDTSRNKQKDRGIGAIFPLINNFGWRRLNWRTKLSGQF